MTTDQKHQVDPELEKPDPPPNPREDAYQLANPQTVGRLPNGLKIDKVDGGPIRDHAAYDFMLGGHDNFYKFMPKNTIAIERTSSPEDQKRVLIHELIERELMQNNGKYQEAHHVANQVERKIRRDPARIADIQLTRDGAKLAHLCVPELALNGVVRLHGVLDKIAAEIPEGAPAGAPSDEVAHLVGCQAPQDQAPGLLVDLDGTIRETEGCPCPYELGTQRLRPNVLTIFRALKGHGFRIVGVTNHTSGWPGDDKSVTPERLREVQQETHQLCGGLLDDILYCPKFNERVLKPAPTMLEHAIKCWSLDPARTCMVGDTEPDRGAAEAAGVPYLDQATFFGDPEATLSQLEGLMGLKKQADAIQLAPRNEYLMFNPEGQIAVKPAGFRRFDLPTQGQGKRVPYEQPLRWVPPEGVPEQGIHGYEVQLNTGESTEAPQGFTWHDPNQVLRSLYGGMGRKENARYRELDRTRARALLRLLKRRKASSPGQQVTAAPPAAP